MDNTWEAWLTEYNGRFEELEIVIYACVLVNLYRGFFDKRGDDSWEEEYTWIIDFDFEETDYFALGQLFGIDKQLGFLSNTDEIIKWLVDKYKGCVYKYLMTELNISEVFHYMSITRFSEIYTGGYEYDPETDEEIETSYKIDSYESFLQSIDKIDILNNPDSNDLAAFEWLDIELPKIKP